MASSALALVTVVGTAFAVAATVTALLIRRLSSWGMVDRPGRRSSHQRVTPRGGGLGILAGLGAAGGVAAFAGLPPLPATFVLAVAMVAAVGFWDDRAGETPPWIRLAVHLAAAALVVVPAGGLERLPLPQPLDPPLGALGIALGLLWVVAVINFVNFLDGIDGVAGTQLAITGLAFAFASSAAPAWLGAALAAACVGFLLHNWHPAKIFMGDVGSGSLGLLVAALPFLPGELDSRQGVLLAGVSLFLFLADAVLTLARRGLRGERLWQAHREHLYQRMVAGGASHARVTLGIGLGAALLSMVAVWATGGEARWGVAFLVAAGVFGLEVVLAARRA